MNVSKLVKFLLIILLVSFSQNSLAKVKPAMCVRVYSERLRAEELYVPKFVKEDNELIYIAKIYNKIDKINKKVYLVFEPFVKIKGNVDNFKLDVTFLHDKFISRRLVGCSILWQLENLSSYRIMLITSKKIATEKKNTVIGSDGIDLKQFMDNSIGFDFDANTLKIKDIKMDIKYFNDYINSVNVKIANKKLKNNEVINAIKERKRLNLFYFSKFQTFLNKELENASLQNKISKKSLETIKNLNDVIRNSDNDREMTLKELDSIFPDRNEGARAE